MIFMAFSIVVLILSSAGSPSFEKSGLSFIEQEELILGMFHKFAVTFGKNYKNSGEFQLRYLIFKDNLKTIRELNRMEQGTAEYGVTKFADLTFAEFLRNYTGLRIAPGEWKRHSSAIAKEPEEIITFADEEGDLDEMYEEIDALSDASDDSDDEEEDIKYVNGQMILPRQYDYRKKQAVTPARDQGNCGSCWAFSVIANIEGVWARLKKKLVPLSEQVLLDCDSKNKACDGGWMETAVKELARLGGIPLEKSYPYLGKKGVCKFDAYNSPVKVVGTLQVPPNERKIAKTLIKNGPLSNAIVVSVNFQFYIKGIFDPRPSECSRNKSLVNHGMALVAYGQEKVGKKKLNYWALKNSWGSTWGESGFMRISRGKGSCALNAYVSTAYI